MEPFDIRDKPGKRAAADPTGHELEMAVQASNSFGLAMYERLAREAEGENLFWSPVSVSCTLTMAAEGARRETAEEMGRTLALSSSLHRDEGERPWDLMPMHTGMANLIEALQPQSEADTDALRARIEQLRRDMEAVKPEAWELGVEGRFQDVFRELRKSRRLADELNTLQQQVDRYGIRMANALWCEESYEMRPRFLEVIEAHYGSSRANSVNFKSAAEAGRNRINAWVEEQTRHRVRDLLPSGSVNELTRMILTNAIYFKGEWREPFEPSHTKLRPFTLATGESIHVPVMADSLLRARYGAFDENGKLFFTPEEVEVNSPEPEGSGPKGWAVVEIPYKGGEISMLCAAPNRSDGLHAIEAHFAAGRLESWVRSLKGRKVNVVLPRFRLETGYSLKARLQALGMVRAFELPSGNSGAQFDGMTASRVPDDRLFLSEVFHRAFVEMDEKGTEVAAATAEMNDELAVMPATRPHVPTFRADRPFFFAIRHAPTRVILFMGRTMRPE